MKNTIFLNGKNDLWECTFYSHKGCSDRNILDLAHKLVQMQEKEVFSLIIQKGIFYIKICPFYQKTDKQGMKISGSLSKILDSGKIRVIKNKINSCLSEYWEDKLEVKVMDNPPNGVMISNKISHYSKWEYLLLSEEDDEHIAKQVDNGVEVQRYEKIPQDVNVLWFTGRTCLWSAIVDNDGAVDHSTIYINGEYVNLHEFLLKEFPEYKKEVEKFHKKGNNSIDYTWVDWESPFHRER